MRVSEIRVKQIRVNQGLGVLIISGVCLPIFGTKIWTHFLMKNITNFVEFFLPILGRSQPNNFGKI